jgi:hypothetical protein
MSNDGFIAQFRKEYSALCRFAIVGTKLQSYSKSQDFWPPYGFVVGSHPAY